MADWVSLPIDLTNTRDRRLFAEEFVTRLQPTGTATIAEMKELNLSLFMVPATPLELGQVAEAARRLGWVERPQNGTEGSGEWRITERGFSVRRPPSLGIGQVIARIVNLADPVRKEATDWLPVLAVVAGAATATFPNNSDAVGVLIRTLAIVVVAAALLRQGLGELDLIRATKRWPRLQASRFHAPVARFYNWPRFGFAIVFDITVLALFGLAIITHCLALVALGVSVVLLLLIQIRWRRQRKAVEYKQDPETETLEQRVLTRVLNP